MKRGREPLGDKVMSVAERQALSSDARGRNTEGEIPEARRSARPPAARPQPTVTFILLSRPLLVNPSKAIALSLVSFFCLGSAPGRHLMGSDEEQVGQSNNAQWRCPAEMSSV
jgi:hypothetical protein